MNNPYLELTEKLNQGRLRVLLSSGQAVVVHRLAVMSKDGDWIVREDIEAVGHVLEVLSSYGARYRFGAPLDEGRGVLEDALDRERRVLMRINEERLARYQTAAEAWARLWPEVQRQLEGLSLLDAHRVVVSRAEGVLPFELSGGES
ncbi:MAG TPA: hypothetical protein VKM72_10710 [Thermoanaerobaculia bacterium]|nr:hypothetical protein [Thermoanaerobaculia bacterium]